MAREVIVRLVDDIDPNVEADETVSFGIDGENFEIDLSSEHATALREALATYVAHARRAKVSRRSSHGKPSPQQDRELNQKIREWARERGAKVSDRGRIPQPIVDAYHGRPSSFVPTLTPENEEKARARGLEFDSPNKERLAENLTQASQAPTLTVVPSPFEVPAGQVEEAKPKRATRKRAGRTAKAE
jgi:hypothetical protein